MMSDTLNEITVEVINDLSEASTGQKRRREGKLRSKAWDHFTKLVKEDGTVDKCECNHCHKLFTCAGKTGTTHLLRHITEGTCSVYNKDKKERPQKPFSARRRTSDPRGTLGWKFDQVMGQPSQQMGLQQDDGLPLGFDDIECQVTESYESEYGGRSSMPLAKYSQPPTIRSVQRGEPWTNELRACVGKLIELTNAPAPKIESVKPSANVIESVKPSANVIESVKPSANVAPPDYSLAAAVKCLNEMEDIPQSSEMYLDAFEVLKDEGERECFICLPPEPRRRWLQRMLQRHFPLRYDNES